VSSAAFVQKSYARLDDMRKHSVYALAGKSSLPLF
jgi:hypothetical protein